MFLAALLLVQAAAACPATRAPLPAELRGWSAMRPVAAGATPPMVTVGQGVRATLLPTAAIRLAVPNTRPQAPDSHAGLFAFAVPTAGRYRVAVGAGVWIDVVTDGTALTSVAHGHGPACSPVRKMVDFDLRPGRYLLQVAGHTAPTLDLMIVRVPTP